MKEAAPAARSPDINFSIALGLGAFLIRAIAALWLAREPIWDGHYYHFGAQRIAQGQGYSEDALVQGVTVWKPWAHYPVGYSGFLGGIYRIFGSGLEIAPLANALLGALTVVLSFRIARTFLSTRRSYVAGILVALHPGLVAYTAAVMTEGLASFLLLLAAWLLIRSRGSLGGAALHGVSLGLATLVRPTSLFILPLVFLVNFQSKKLAFARLIVSCVLALLVIAPWTIRNCVRMDGCTLVSTNGGWNLAIGALTEDGRFRTLRPRDGCEVVTGQVQQDRCWANVGLATIMKSPLHWLGLMPDKLRQTFNHESFIVEYLHEADPTRWNETLRAQARAWLTRFHGMLLWASAFSIVGLGPLLPCFLKSARIPHWRRPALTQGVLLLTFVLGGAFALSDDFHPFWPFALVPALVSLLRLPGQPEIGPVGRYLFGLILSTALVHAVFFGDDRYHLVISPVLCILAAAALRGPTPRTSELP